MIGTIRKHSKALWLIVITAIIITFVYWGTPNQNDGGAVQDGNLGSIDGKSITREEYVAGMREAKLLYFLRTGRVPDNDDQVLQQGYLRLLLARKLEQFGIQTSSDTVAKAASDFLRANNQGQPVPIEAFEAQVLKPLNLTVDDFARYMRHDLGIQQLISVAGLGGNLVTPEEARSFYTRERQEISAQAVFLNATNYLDQVVVTPEAIGEFYTNRMSAYRLPDRVQVAYIEFPASNYITDAEQEISQAPDLPAQIDAEYQRMGGTNFFRDQTPEEAKKTIRDQAVKRQALNGHARRKAYEFVTALGDIKQYGTDSFAKLAAEKNFEVKISEPFDRQFPPDNLKVRAEFSRLGFALSPGEHPFDGPVMGEESAFVIAHHKQIPSSVPPFEEVRERVTEDFKFQNAVMMARQTGEKFVASLTNALAQGKTFTAACAENNVRSVLLTPFSLSSSAIPEIEDQDTLFRVKQAAYTAKPGTPSEFVLTPEGGFILFVQSRLPVDETRLAAELPQFMEQLRRVRENESFNRWLAREGERANFPINRNQRPTAPAPPPEVN
jgi:hypothetical protein